MCSNLARAWHYELFPNCAHIIPYFKFQLRPSAERAVPLLVFPSKQPTNGSFRSVDLYVSYLTFDFLKYKHFVLWLSIDFPHFRPKRDSSAVALGLLHCQILLMKCFLPPAPHFIIRLFFLKASELDLAEKLV